MSKPAPQSDSGRKTSEQQASSPGIINDLPAQVSPAGGQSMMVNDLYARGAMPAGQEMIINDIPNGPVPGGTQRLIVNDVQMPQNAAGAHQMIVSDAAFTNLVRGFEALTQGQVPAGNPMIVNDLAPAPQPAPGTQIRPTPRPAMHAQPQPTLQRMMQQAVQQQQTTARPPQAMPQPAAMPRPAAAIDPRLPRPATQQPMVINTPQPLVKPRREDPLPSGQQLSPTQRLAQQLASRAAAAPATATEKAPASKSDRKSAAAIRKNSGRVDAAKVKPQCAEQWKGSYSGRTMTPSWLLCIAMTVAFVWVAFRYLPGNWRLEFLAATVGFVWTMQLVRWAYRVLGYRYRITEENLHLHRGLLYGKPVNVPRCEIVKVSISANLLDRMLGVGKVVVQVKDEKREAIELEGVRQPRELVKMIDPKKTKAA
jgi:membrane protein YdbS with pleckstrin-like domain